METNIRMIRRMKKMTLKELSQKTGITTAYLSMIERSQREPTLSTLFKIASALDVRTESLWTDLNAEEALEEQEGSFEVMERDHRKGYKRLYPGVAYESITSNRYLDGKSVGMIGHIGRLTPGADTNPDGKGQHEEDELIFMLRGTIRCEFLRDTVQMQEGDSMLIRKHTPHKFINIGTQEAEFIMVRYVQQ